MAPYLVSPGWAALTAFFPRPDFSVGRVPGGQAGPGLPRWGCPRVETPPLSVELCGSHSAWGQLNRLPALPMETGPHCSGALHLRAPTPPTPLSPEPSVQHLGVGGRGRPGRLELCPHAEDNQPDRSQNQGLCRSPGGCQEITGLSQGGQWGSTHAGPGTTSSSH